MMRRWPWWVLAIVALRALQLLIRSPAPSDEASEPLTVLAEAGEEAQTGATAPQGAPASSLPEAGVGTWHLYAISPARDGGRSSDLTRGAGCRAVISLHADGTWRGRWQNPAGTMADSGTWRALSDRYVLTAPESGEPDVLFKDEPDVCQVADDGTGAQAWLWFHKESAARPEERRQAQGEAAVDPIAGIWDQYALSDSYAGPKDQIAAATTAVFHFRADGTWSFEAPASIGGLTDTGTWARRGDVYLLTRHDGVTVPPVFRQRNELYQVTGRPLGYALHAWFRRR